MKIKIQHTAYLKLKYFTKLCNTEISGLGKIQQYEDNTLEIYDFEIFKQKVSFAHSTLSEEDLVKFLYEKTQHNESVVDYKVWWHSHCNMDVFFSSIDDNTIENSTEFPYLVSIVTNKAGHLQARFDLYKPIRLTIPVELEIINVDNEALQQLCQDEIMEKVRPTILTSILNGRQTFLTRKYSKNQ